jgi:cell division protein FtsW
MSVLERFRALREARAEQAAVSTPPRARESRPDGTEPRVVTRNVSMRPGAPDSVAAPVAAPKQAPAGRFPRVTGTADVVLAATIIGLVFFGVVMVYSASGSLANTLFDDGYHYLVRQAIYAVVGLAIMVVIARVDYHRYQAAYVTYPILMAAFALLVVVALGGGRTVGGAARWIDLKVVRVQPAEIAKLAIIFYLSYSLSKKRDQLRDFKIGFLPHVLVAGVFMLLCLKQPDFGSAVMIGVLTVVLLFTAGTRVNYILGVAAIGIPLAYALDHELRVPHAPHRGVREPLRGPRGRGLPDRRVAHQLRAGRHVGRGHRRQPPEARLPARGPHRLHQRHRGRRAGPAWA